MRRAFLVLALWGCDDASGDAFDTPRPRVDPDAAPVPQPGPCEGFACLPCGNGRGCGPEPHLGDTCCTEGDPIEHVISVSASEVVDVQTDGRFVFACGGFGATLFDMAEADDPAWMGVVTERCQHAVAGAAQNGGRVVYFAHHGDSWGGRPRLSTFHVSADGNKLVDEIVDPNVLFEGMAYADGFLYVAAHDGGLRIYRAAADGSPVHETTVPDLGNAWKVELNGDVAYVVDNDFGLHVVDIREPTAPVVVGAIPSIGQPRDLAVAGDRLYLALGSLGVEVFDASEPSAPVPLSHVETLGSAQSVAARNDLFAVAAWTHAALYDAESMRPIALQRTRHRDQFEQDLAVEWVGDRLVVGEWEALHVFRHNPGRVAPDLWLDEDLFAFSGDAADARAVVVRNQGHTALRVDLRVDSGALGVEPTSLVVAPLSAAVAELTFTPPGTPGARLVLTTNDPDEPRADMLVEITDSENRLDVGDALTEDFAFLDPTGANDLDNLRGQVTILAYFALF